MDITEDTIYNRCYYVLDRMVELIPEEGKEHPLAQMLTFFIREGKKDIRRIPEDFIFGLSGQIGEAFTWVAQGSMDDLKHDPNEFEHVQNCKQCQEYIKELNDNDFEENDGDIVDE